MKKRDLEKLGIVGETAQKEAVLVASRAKSFGIKKSQLKVDLESMAKSPGAFLDHDLYGPLAQCLNLGEERREYVFKNLTYPVWGEDIERDALQQMKNACELPIAVKAALMPDAHVGYGLPIGGVLATDNAVVPYAVGVDIACRVKLTVFDIPASEIERRREPLAHAIERNTEFGIGAKFKHPKNHPVMEVDWSFSKYVESLRDIAWRQLGTSGSGNHFVEFGAFELLADHSGVAPGNYLALVSHSGSRGSGAKIAHHFSRLAREKHPDLPHRLQHLSWLSLEEPEGQEYWAAMELMGEYASANHYLIHRDVTKAVGGEILFQVENHHNFAWKEEHDGRTVIVHRKGATPAGRGELGYIPGTMADPGFLVSGRGSDESLRSCSHGAGRRMSRKAAKQKSTQSGLRSALREKGITLLDAGLDEAPLAYKDIHQVMAAQSELVDILGRFQPKIVKMAPEGERPED
ncbi:MAG: RtcB family protein [Bdellovibrionales bacterium]|nr:RtcB family protein [Bdellovibrionales bacterium]